MSTVVMKFGGASLSAPENFFHVANLVLSRTQSYKNVVVVVSAMGNTTNELLDLARKIHPEPPRREQDMMVSVGERISMALLAMALARKGKEAISLTGSQSGIITTNQHSEARILEVKPSRILKNLEKGKIVIVAGFQGVSFEGEITTLGRGGSDTSAVALGVALSAEKVEFFKDVEGIFPEDPKKNENLKYFDYLSYDDALSILKNGAKVLHTRSVELAQKNQIPLHVLCFQDPQGKGTWIGPNKRVEPIQVPKYEGACYEHSSVSSGCS